MSDEVGDEAMRHVGYELGLGTVEEERPLECAARVYAELVGDFGVEGGERVLVDLDALDAVRRLYSDELQYKQEQQTRSR